MTDKYNPENYPKEYQESFSLADEEAITMNEITGNHTLLDIRGIGMRILKPKDQTQKI